MPNWGDPGRLAQRSANDLVQVIKSGVAPAMPAYASQYSDDQLWALADYIRTLLLRQQQSRPGRGGRNARCHRSGRSEPRPPFLRRAARLLRRATIIPFKMAIAGKVTTASGSPLPAGLKVTLQGFDATMNPYWSATADVQPDGSYKVNDVEIQSGRTFMATVEYQNMPFTSQPLHATDLKEGQDGEPADQPVGRDRGCQRPVSPAHARLL